MSFLRYVLPINAKININSQSNIDRVHQDINLMRPGHKENMPHTQHVSIIIVTHTSTSSHGCCSKENKFAGCGALKVEIEGNHEQMPNSMFSALAIPFNLLRE